MEPRRSIRTMGVGLAAALVLMALPTIAAATPGDLVLPFGGGDGRVSLAAGFQTDVAAMVDLSSMADGRAVVLLQRFGDDTLSRTIQRLDADGQPDVTWNGGGTVNPPNVPTPFAADPARVAVDSASRVLYSSRATLTRYTALGVLDTGFAGDGTLAMSTIVPAASQIRDIHVLPDDRVELLVDFEAAGGSTRASLVRVTATGAPDPTFSSDGRYDIPPLPGLLAFGGLDLERDAAGSLYASVTNDGGRRVVKVASNGSPVTGFGTNGVASALQLPNELAVDGSGRVMAFYGASSSLYVTRLTAAGQPDTSWGPDGTAEITFPSSVNDVTDAVVLGSAAYLSVRCDCQGVNNEVAAIAALDLTTGDPKADFDAGDLDGAGVAPLGAMRSAAIALEVGPAGTFRIGTRSTLSPLALPQVVQASAVGTADPTYSSDGRVDVGLRRHRLGDATSMAVGPGGEIVTIGTLDDGASGVFVSKVTAAGVRDASFGTNGTVVVAPDDPSDVLQVWDVEVLPDGRVAALYRSFGAPSGTPSGVLLLIDETGDPDASFGDDGRVAVGLATPSSADGIATALTVAGTGETFALYVGGVTLIAAPRFFVQRVDLDGAIDHTYGAADGSPDGWASFPYAGASGAYDSFDDLGFEIAGASDGTVMWGALANPPGGTNDQGVAVGRFAANGVVDLSFGTNGSRTHTYGFLQDFAMVQGLVRRADGGADLLARVGVAEPFVMRTTGTGALDSAYGGGDGIAIVTLPSTPTAAASQAGRAVFAFRPEGQGPTNLLRLTTTGALDTTFGPNGRRISAHTPRLTTQPFMLGGDAFLALPDAVVLEDSVVAAGPGEASGVDAELVKISTERVAPGPPTGVTATGGDSLATVTWTPPSSDGGAPVLSYQVTASPGGATCSATASAGACVVPGLTNGQGYTFTVTATTIVGTSVPSAPSNSATPAAGAGAFVPLPTPKRFVDSRNPAGDTDDELEERFGSLNAGTTRAIPIAGRLGVPVDTATVVLSVVAVSPTASGYFTVFPCGTAQPSTSSLNFTKSVNLANTVITTLGVGGANAGKVCVFTSVKTDLIIDASGSLASSAVTPLPTPKRFVDSRNPAGDTDDEQEERFGSLNAGTTRAIPIAGRLGFDGTTENVVLSVVAVSPTASGYLTVFPCGTPQPSTSSLNFTKSVNLANTVITTLGTTGADTGKVCVFTSVKTDLIIDASGSLTSPAFTALDSPKRFADSRLTLGDTDDEQEERFGTLNAGTTRAIPIADRLGFDTTTRNVVLSVVAVSPTASGYFTVYPCGTPRPSTSSLNFTKSINLANTVITTLGVGGANAAKVCVYTSVKTDLIIDASGSLT